MDTSKIRKRMPVATLLDPKIVVPAIGQAFVKLNPTTLIKNPVMFVLEVVTALTTVILVRDLFTGGGNVVFEFQIVLWLWFTVLFANFAEAVAEGRGKAQADTLRKARTETRAKRIQSPSSYKKFETVAADKLRAGDLVVCEANDIIPGDGDVIEGIASVNEAAITGESAPVIREFGRRPFGGYRRHHRHFRPHHHPHHVFARVVLPRPYDQAGRRRRAPEDAERNRTRYPAGRPDHHLRVRDGDDPELCDLCGRCRVGCGAGRAVRHLDPDDDRRAAVGDRHCRHGSPGAVQRARHVRARGGSRR